MVPAVSTECIFCFEPSNSTIEKPYFDFLILPVMVISGGLMIADRKLPKNKHGLPMKLSGIQLLSVVVATTLSWIHSTEFASELDGVNTKPQFFLYCISAILLAYYILTGPKCQNFKNNKLLSLSN